MLRPFVGSLFVCAAFFTLGCGSDSATPAPAPAPPVSPASTPEPDSGPKPPGQLIFDKQRCTDCHSINGSALTGKMRAPDLSHIGAAHAQDWIVAHIRDPKSHKPMSRMPAYGEDKLNAKDAAVLGEYLTGLK